MWTHPKIVGFLSTVIAFSAASSRPATACSTCSSPGDGDGDCRVSLVDYRVLNACLAGPDATSPLECACFDMNADGHVDLRDAAKFQQQFTGAELLSTCTLPPRADEPGTLEAPHSIWPVEPQASISDPAPSDTVRAFSGEFHLHEADLRIPGRGFDFVWARTYRSRTGSSTSMGNGWSHAYDLHLQPLGGDLILHGSDGRMVTFCPNSSGGWSDPESFHQIVQLPGGDYALQFHDRSSAHLIPHNIIPGRYVLGDIVDRNGNTMTFDYDPAGRLTAVHDTLDDGAFPRVTTIAYNPDGFVSSVTDFSGRQVTYTYYQNADAGGDFGDLRSVTSPPVVGTPNGNDFPTGKTTTYTYSEGLPVAELNHNLLTITDPKGQTYLSNTYAATLNPADFLFDRVVSQQLGDATQVLNFHYEPLTPDASNHYAVVVGVVNDRAGNVSECYYDYRNRMCALRQYTGRATPGVPTTLIANRPTGQLRASDPPYFESLFEYNAQSLLTRSVDSELSVTEVTYAGDDDFFAPPQNKAAPKTHVHRAGPRGGDQTEIVETYEYNPALNHDTNQVTRMVTGRGTEVTYAYDTHGNLTLMGDRSPSVVHDYEYNAFGQLTLHRLPDNGSGSRREDETTYYPPGPQYGYVHQQIVDRVGLHITTTHEWSPVGDRTRVVDAMGHDQLFDVNALKQPVRWSAPELHSGSGNRAAQLYFYDANDNLTRLDVENRDASGTLQPNAYFSTVYEYDVLNRLTLERAEVDALHDAVTTYAYDANGNPIETCAGECSNGNQPTNRVRTTYDERDLALHVTRAPADPLSSTTQYDYDGTGHITIVGRGLESGAPQVSTYAYDGHNRLTLHGDHFGNVRTLHYDANDNVVSELESGETLDVPGSAANVRLSEVAYGYDALDRLTIRGESFFDAAQAPLTDGTSTTQYTYSDDSQLLSVTDDNGHTTSCTYDTANRRSACTDALGNLVQVTYDPNSNVLAELEVAHSDLGLPDESFTTTYGYDRLNRLTLHGDNFGNTALRAYDSRNLPVSSTDALGNLVTYGYDGLMRLTVTGTWFTATGSGGAPPVATAYTTQTWDDSSRLVSQTDSNSHTTNYTYDALDRLTIRGMADATQESFQYDVFDNNTARHDANGNTIAYAYDGLNRLTLKGITVAPGVAGDTTFESYAYDGRSRIVSAQDDDASVTLEYDSLSNVRTETLNGVATHSSHDGAGNLTQCIYPSGRTITRTFDALDRVKTVNDPPLLLAQYDYVGPDRIARCARANGASTEYTYDGITGIPNAIGDFGVKEVSSILHVHGTMGPIDARTFRWDPMANKTSRMNQLNGREHVYTYDSAYRLTGTVLNDTWAGSVVRDTDYQLDLSGNRNSVVDDNCAGAYVLESVSPPADDQVNQYTVTGCDTRTYDENGNLTQSTSTLGVAKTHLYDYRDRLVHAFDAGTGVTTVFAYDPFDRLIRKTVVSSGPVTTDYYYITDWGTGDWAIFNGLAGSGVIEEQTAGSPPATYVHGAGGEALEMQRAQTSYYFHADDLGNIVALTDPTGRVVERYDYRDYGQPEFYDEFWGPRSSSIVQNPILFASHRYDESTGLYDYAGRYLDPLAGRFITRAPLGGADAMGNSLSYLDNNPWSSAASGKYVTPCESDGINEVLPYATLHASKKKGDRISLVGFGSFSVSKRAARTGRNPQTGKEIQIAAKKGGDKISLVGFGSFSVSQRAARVGRNPQTGKEIQIAAKKVAKFKAGSELAGSVNKGKRTSGGGGGGGGGCGGELSAIESRDILKTYFETGDIPTQDQGIAPGTTGPFNPNAWQTLATGKVPRSVLKSFFETGDKPTQQQFANLIDSYVHHSDDSVTDYCGQTNHLRTRLNELEERLKALGLLAFTTAGSPLVDGSGSSPPSPSMDVTKPKSSGDICIGHHIMLMK